MKSGKIFAATALVLSATPLARAQDAALTIGTGYSFLRADELVFENGDRLSHLIWHSDAPIVTVQGTVDFGNDWSLNINTRTAAFGSSRMQDFDWLLPHRRTFDFADWTHRSTHPDTLLHHYFAGDISLGKDVSLWRTPVNLHAGLTYTTVSWRANDGSAIYSDNAFRDTIVAPIPGRPSISFAQKLPGIFAGLEATQMAGRWELEGRFRAGVTLRPSDVDHHWRRDLKFDDQYSMQPFVTARVRANYQLSGATSLFVGADYDHYFKARGDSTMTVNSTGAPLNFFKDGVGTALRSLTISTGFKVAF